ncbi:hypothetical protein [Kaistia granuli]|uniref:hypothetical protein n=1 Tax=Kaistia granuli TaxID=363259 RepID=UPI00035D8AF7|nr:hypothetical protein [Kaistia granuli]
MSSDDTGRPLSPWAICARLQEKVSQQKGARISYDTADLLLRALRAYIANPNRDRIAAIMCMRHNVKREPCRPLCRRCQETAWELKCLMRGEEKVFSDEWER